MKRLAACILLAIGLSVTGVAYAADDTPEWVEVSRRKAVDSELPSQQDAVEVVIKDGAVFISTARPVKVEVFSILGQLITSKTISEGTVRLNLRQRGVYILKAGPITRRINL